MAYNQVMKTILKQPDIDRTAAEALVAECHLRPLTARILVSRGVDTPEKARLFLSSSLTRDWYDPSVIPGLMEAADKVESVIRAGGRILIFGDFDVDGITATTISVRGLKALGADVQGIIPHRYTEGYALSRAAVDRGRAFNPDLVMTVDCGISCGEEVAWMLSEGLDVVITDHHEAGENVPCGVPVADPKLDPDCPSRDLAGCGVALKLISVLGERLGKPDAWRQLTDFAALGTIADLMNLSLENRALVADGIKRMNTNPRACLSALATICGVKMEELTSNRLSFSLIPRLNAAGRMGDATVALNLLLCDDPVQSQELANELDQVNSQRRQVESELTAVVKESLAESFDGQPVIVAAGEGWHEGVKGIVASRIAREYHRPTLIFSIEDGMARGSGRTYGDINLYEAASAVSDLFEKFGGHAAALGITLPADKLGELEQRLCDALSAQVEGKVEDVVEVSAVATLDECTVDGFQELELLQPFGNTNPVPLLAVQGAFMSNRSVVGKSGNHLRFFATDGASRVAGIWFGVPEMDRMLNCEAPCDIVFEPSVDEWQHRLTAKLMTKRIIAHDEQAPIPDDDPTEELLSRAAELCETGDYAGITAADQFPTKVVGVTFENRQAVLSDLEAGCELALVRQPDNEFDACAIAVQLPDGTQLGYLNRRLSARLAPYIDAGNPYDAAVLQVTGGPQSGQAGEDVRKPGPLGVRDPGVVDRSYGVNIIVRKAGAKPADEKTPEELRLELSALKEQWRQTPSDQLDEQVKRALIGEHSLHEAQAKTLQNLKAGISTLTIMATGRGKSLIFHMHAARTALKANKASVFIYPLRALVADQAFHLQETYGRFGLEVRVITGETDQAQRDAIYSGLANGDVDVVLTTPEFLSIHADRFAATGRIGFIVVDEAHHVGQSKAGNRPAYAALSETLETLGRPLVLAVTATAGDEEAKMICSTLGISAVVLDPTVRANLHLDDRRDLRDRESYLASLVATGTKCVAYVNSREQSIQLTRMLRHRLPAMAPRIAFYNAGLPKTDRKRIEGAFRSGELMAIISTSAFGEGIDIPDVEHVVLYHLPFSSIEFNQMAGRSGRDGRDATVHLLYGYGDARINEKILGSSAPPRQQMVALYKALRAKNGELAASGEDGLNITNSELADAANAIDKRAGLDESAVSCGISVFRELGFLETSGRSVARRIRMVEGPDKMSLESSVRYREGMEEIEQFGVFKRWALDADAQQLLERFNRPILPTNPDDLIA